MARHEVIGGPGRARRMVLVLPHKREKCGLRWSKCYRTDQQTCTVASSVREADPNNYGQVMRSGKKYRWVIAIKKGDRRSEKEWGMGFGKATQGKPHFAHQMCV